MNDLSAGGAPLEGDGSGPARSVAVAVIGFIERRSLRLQYRASAIASLVLISIGLAIIFGMMRVINLAHGEFLMLGGYAAITATKAGVNIWIAMLVVAPVVGRRSSG